MITAAFDMILKIRETRIIKGQTQNIIRSMKMLAKIPINKMQQRLKMNNDLLPRQRLNLLEKSTNRDSLSQRLLENGVYTTFASWKDSTGGYASAFSAWMNACQLFGHNPNKPTRTAVEAFASLFRNGDSLKQYLHRIRKVYEWLHIPVEALCARDCATLIKGAIKLTDPNVRREKYAATAKQTKQLVSWLRRQGQDELADSFIVARQYALRFKSECIPLQWSSLLSNVQMDDKSCTIHTSRKTSGRNVIPICRNCICHQQSQALCGCCI
jgi:hypothetical protein